MRFVNHFVQKDIRGILVFLLIAIPLFVFSQVARLSDAQVREFWRQMKSQEQGVGDVVQVAMQRGFSREQAVDLRNRIIVIERDERRRQGEQEEDEFGGPLLSYQEQQEQYQRRTDSARIASKLFGYDVFERPDLGFNLMLGTAPPKDYILGSGDEVAVVIYGTSQEQVKEIINPNGSIIIPVIGPVKIGGLTIDAAEQKLKFELGKIYRGLIAPNPSVFLELTLAEMRTIKLNIVGEVKRPGSYILPAYSNVFNALFTCGGPSINGTFRNIKVYRGGQLVYAVDLYGFLTKGQNLTGYQVLDNDIIVVSPFDNRIEVKGAVKRTGYFEMKEGESLQDLIDFAGGFAARAERKTISLERLSGTDEVVKDVDPDTTAFDFIDGDVVIVRELKDPLIDMVSIQGAVYKPGNYEWRMDMPVQELINKAGGLLPDAETTRSSLFRKSEDLVATLEPLNIDQSSQRALRSGDVLFVPSRYDLQENSFIMVSGEIQNSGPLPFYEGMSALDAIILSGGLNRSSVRGLVEIARRVGQRGNEFEVIQLPITDNGQDSSKLEFRLKAYDHVFIRSIAGYQEEVIVTVKGEVNYPGEYVVTESNMTISRLLKRAGGLTESAFVDGATLFRRTEAYKAQSDVARELARLEEIRDFLENEKYLATMSSYHKELLDERVDNAFKNYFSNEVIGAEEPEISTSVLLELSGETDGPVEDAKVYDRIGISLSKILEGDISEDLELMKGDVLYIPKPENIVRIRGQVNYNTSAKFTKSYNWRQYISQAGGYNVRAKPGQGYIVYPNGEASKVRKFLFFRFYPQVKPGSEIIIPGGRQPFQFTPERIVALTTSLLTTYILIDNIQQR